MPKTPPRARRRTGRRQAMRYRVWRSINIAVGLATIVNVSALAALVTPQAAFAADTGYSSPSSNSVVETVVTNPTNAYAQDSVDAVFDSSSSLLLGTFGFAVPAGSTINGIEVQTRTHRVSGNGNKNFNIAVSWNNGTTWSSSQTTTNTSSTYVIDTLGGPANTWGHSWTVAETGNGSFAVLVADNFSQDTAGVDVVQAKIYYTPPTTGTIELKKVWSGTPGTVTLNIGSTAGGSDIASATVSTNDTTGTKTVNTGTYYVSETGSLTNYSSNLTCTDNGQSITPGTNSALAIATGHAIICTYTNTRNTGTIELRKVWSGTPGTTTLAIGTTAGASDIASTPLSANGTTGAKTVNTGTYFASETTIPNFTPSALTCFNDANNNGLNDNETVVTVGANNSVAVASNQHVICSFTNTRDTGSLTLTKVVDVGAASASTFGFTIAPDPNNVGVVHPTAGSTGTYTFTNLPTGSYTVTESNPATNYHQVSTTCANVSVTKDATATCTIHNTHDSGTIELKKVWSGTAGTTTLNVGTTAGASDIASTTVSTNGTTGTKTVLTGTYFVAESGPLTNHSTSLVCTDNGQSVTPGTNNALIVASGHTVICTFTNTRNTGTVELKKVWSGTPGTTTLAIGTTVGGNQIASQVISGANGTTSPTTVDTGTYYLSETTLADYSSTIACDNNVTLGANNSLTVANNQHVVCTFTNVRLTGTIELKKVWSGTPGTTTLNIGTTVGGSDAATTTVSANGTTGAKTVNTGTYYLSETALAGYSPAVACDNGVTLGANNSVQVGNGAHVVCTFTNIKSVMTITVDKIGQSTVNAGANITYTINWSVNGNTGATNAVITDPIPANTTFVSATNGGTFAAGTVTWNLGAQPSGSSGTVSVTLKVNSPLTNGSAISNTATFDTDQTDPVNHTVRTIVASTPSLSITKSNSVTSFVNPGASLNYTVVVTNAAAATNNAVDVTLTDVLPSGFTFAVGAGSTKTFSLGTIAPGVSVTTTYAANVSTGQTAGTYTNTATAKGTNTATVTASSTVEVRVPAVLGVTTADPSLTVTKTVDDAEANPGQVLNYTINVTNTGPGVATNVVVTDTLPAGLTFVDGGTSNKSWSIGTLAAGTGKSITTKVKISTGAANGTYTNHAIVTSTELDPVEVQVSVHVTAPQVLGLATTGARRVDYTIFDFGALLLVAGVSLLGRRFRLQRS